jgi:hypothetical protein
MDRWERCLCDFEGALPARLQFRMQQPVSADWHNEAKKINLFKGGRQKLARRVAEAEIDLRRIRYSRHRFLSAALSDGPPEHVLDKLPVMGNLRRPNAPEMRALVKDVTSTAQALEKIGTILWREGNRLLVMDRYEPPALFRRKIAIQAFDATRMLLCLQERNKQP